ncbi:MAG: hypothetical protein NVS9B4_19860 [Candidatus Acidiferrum sp.]
MIAGRSLSVFRSQLLHWFRQSQRDLPWRGTRDPYRIWLSEIMLQQTRVAAVIPYYQRFLSHFPDLHTLAGAPQEEVLRQWSGLGYYSRARNLQKAAQHIVAQHHGIFPRTRVAILSLPGIGRYTANAILSIAMGKTYAVLDGNVARVLARLSAVRGDLRQPQRWNLLQKTADHLLDTKSPGDWNQALMELGATVCTPRGPRCSICPISKFCRARKLGIVDVIPQKRPKHPAVNVTLAAAVFVDPSGYTLLLPPPVSPEPMDQQVPPLVSQMWHFPTVSVTSNTEFELRAFLKTISSALVRAELQLAALPAIRHTVTYRKITVLPFLIKIKVQPRILKSKQIALSDFSSFAISRPVSSLTRKVARAALAYCQISAAR